MDLSEYLPKTASVFVARLFSIISSLLFVYIWMGNRDPISERLIYAYSGGVVLLVGVLSIFFLDRKTEVEYDEAVGKIVVEVKKITHNRLSELLIGIGSVAVFSGLMTLIVSPPSGYGTSVAFFTIFVVGMSRYMTHLQDLPTYITDYETDWRNPTTIDDVPLYEPNPKVKNWFGKIQFIAKIVTLLTVINILGILLLSVLSLFNILNISTEMYQTGVLVVIGIAGVSAFLNTLPSPLEIGRTENQKFILRVVLTSSYGILALGTIGYLFSNSVITFTPATVLLFVLARSWGTNTTAIRSTREATHSLSVESQTSEDAD